MKATSDSAVQKALGERLARVRLERNLTQTELADQAGVSKRTVERLEGGGSTQLSSFIRICRALGLLERLEQLVPPPVPSPIEQLALRGKRRLRARPRRTPVERKPWKWGDE
ncbi:MAG: helix-turn-helix transcriptional regulator [Polyangiaceae bacterium]|nr:helix-turn-helix transcriptional regulator [Polyangiaceae bacterium]